MPMRHRQSLQATTGQASLRALTMSRVAKATLTAALVGTVAVVWGVHYLQHQEGERMYQGVLKDDERRREKQRQREAELQESLRKRAIYERVQPVSKADEQDST